tara:strand:- start:282 stop:989 length:708 start_codon:yes stop_codon:yes gene_type:complete
MDWKEKGAVSVSRKSLCMANLIKSPRKRHAAELYALNPSITNQEVADALQVGLSTLRDWRADPNFVEAVYERYMIEFGGEIPAVLNAMIREAKSGNVQAGRLVLEHSGKLVKNINVTVDSPFEKFMKEVDVAEVVDGEIEEIIDEMPQIDSPPLPERNTQNQKVRARNENKKIKKAIMSEKKKAKYNNQRREWYKWKKRAKDVGVEPLAAKRPTKGQRVAWQEEIKRREDEKKDI